MQWAMGTQVLCNVGESVQGRLAADGSVHVMVYVGIGLLFFAMALMLQVARRRADD